ncbi:MAG: type I DNA topoisomerase [Rhodovibrionaceae bacterium]
MHLVVVESPAKAKTINKYLGPDYEVLASYGHIRDLPAKDGSVRPEADFEMSWQVDEKAEKRIREIALAAKRADEIILATDPDREGEAISWHLVEEMQRRDVLNGKPVKRVVFNEITKSAVQEAFKNPRELNKELIEAYLARRALDYLVGFSLSPILWRKLPGSRSAGRVQSVALRLICEREAEIEVFKAQEYWSVSAQMKGADTEAFEARLTALDGEKLDKFSLPDEASAQRAVTILEQAESFAVTQVERKEVRRNPQPPFTTSTLQQEASRKLGFGATRTMRTAQKLYEGIELDGETVGLITYMRTDGVSMSNEAIGSARNLIADTYGDAYLPDQPRIYKTKARNAQEAHEAIRPTELPRRPEQVARHLGADEQKLYELIWLRALASQMASARLDQVSVDIATGDKRAALRATGSVVVFDGFLRLYEEGRDEPKREGEEENKRLPKLAEGQGLERVSIDSEQHFTQPPPRYSEASLVKKLEELGIGRPSTYASILQVLQDRDYVRLEKRRFLPEDRGRLVTAFLASYFERYVQYNFTAELERELDEISDGQIDWKTVLRNFWEAFSAKLDETKELRISNVIDVLDEELGPHFFPADPEKPDADPRLCPACSAGRLGLRLGKSGGFIGCSNYPDCRYTRPLAMPTGAEGEAADLANKPRALGQDPESALDVTLRKGPYGIYIQLGEAVEKGEKPKRASLPKGVGPDDVDLELALKLLALPREVGADPESGEAIVAGIGRYGPYVKRGSTYKSLPNDDEPLAVLEIGLNRAVALLAEAPKRGGASALKTLGDHPADGKPVTLHSGRYGPYVKHGRLNASLPKGTEADEATLDMAVDLLAKQAGKKKGGRKPKARKSAS